MIRYFFHLVAFLAVAVFEFGFLNSASFSIAYIPLTICVGIYHVFNLKPNVGMAWLIGSGIVQDIHATVPTGDVLIAIFFSLVLIYVVERHITHMSLYASVGTAFAVVLFWMSAKVAVTLFTASATLVDGWFVEVALSAVMSAIFMCTLMIVGPRLRQFLSSYIRVTL